MVAVMGEDMVADTDINNTHILTTRNIITHRTVIRLTDITISTK
jgi:hypothetical protein